MSLMDPLDDNRRYWLDDQQDDDQQDDDQQDDDQQDDDPQDGDEQTDDQQEDDQAADGGGNGDNNNDDDQYYDEVNESFSDPDDLVELDDDTVTVVGGRGRGQSFRQLEVEIGPDGGAVADAVVADLRRAGAISEVSPSWPWSSVTNFVRSRPVRLRDRSPLTPGRRWAPWSPPAWPTAWSGSSITTTSSGSTGRTLHHMPSIKRAWPPVVCGPI